MTWRAFCPAGARSGIHRRKRVLLDGVETLFAGLSNEAVLRSELRRLFRWLKDHGLTAIVTAERGTSSLTRHGLEEYISDCMILLDHRVSESVFTRRLRIVKYRGSTHGTNEFPFLIDNTEFSILPVTSLGLNHAVSNERISSGIPALDAMLGGQGYYRASSILVSGRAGTGKTSMAHISRLRPVPVANAASISPSRNRNGRWYATCDPSVSTWSAGLGFCNFLLAGGIAHDYNNLLVGILGNAGLAQEMAPEGTPLARALEAIVKSSQSAAHLTRQMLAYAGKGQFVVEPVQLSNLVEETMSLLRSTIPSGISVRLDLDRSISPLKADLSQMQQVVMNLIINALEAIGDEPGVVGVRTANCSLDARRIEKEFGDVPLDPGLYVLLEVRDTGSGMDEATKARIFDPFFSTKFMGRGLGLAAVAGIVRGHKGAIRVNSSPGAGSTFTVWFPAADRKK